MRTMEVDVGRPVFVPGAEGAGTSRGQAGEDGLVPFSGEATLPVDVMEALVGRLLTLPPEVRDVVCWRYMGLEYKEIGRRQGITTAGAEARHERAMRLFPELRQLFVVKTARRMMRERLVCGAERA